MAGVEWRDERRRRCDKALGESSSVRSACEGSLQVVLWVGVTAGKLRAAQAQNGFRIRRRGAAQEQFGGDPEIGDAPIGLGKALRNPLAMQPGLIDGGSRLGSGSYPKSIAGEQSDTATRLGWSGCRIWQRQGGRDRRCKRDPARGGLDQRTGLRGQSARGMENFDPGRPSAGQTALGLLIGEAGQSTRMAPVCAGSRPGDGPGWSQ